MGAPTRYTKELGEKICDAVSTCPYGLDRICEENPEFPTPKCIWEWRIRHKDFGEAYARAKIRQADLLAEECLNIARSCTRENWGQSRLLIDTHKWLASKLLPKQYGDRYVVDTSENSENQQALEEVKQLRARLAEKNKRDY